MIQSILYHPDPTMLESLLISKSRIHVSTRIFLRSNALLSYIMPATFPNLHLKTDNVDNTDVHMSELR